MNTISVAFRARQVENYTVYETNPKAQLFSVDEAARVLGGISPWTLRKHIAAGNVKVTRIGRRVLLTAEEVERIRQDGLPSLGEFHKSDHESEAERRNQL
jgi:excisionase family DNA binding protein